MTLEELREALGKSDIVLSGFRTITKLTATKRDDMAADILDAVRAALGAVAAGLNGAVSRDKVKAELAKLDTLVAGNDAAAEQARREKFGP